jgi:hypothetical protein
MLNLTSNDCVLKQDVCVKEHKDVLEKFCKANKITIRNSALETLKKHFNVKNEYDVWNNPQMQKFIGHRYVNDILKSYFKMRGPYNSTKLLNNENIDGVLAQWEEHSQRLFGKKFYHIEFHMRDFLKRDTELSELDLIELINYDCFAVVFNTDYYAGPGKHWLCVYGDMAHEGTQEDPYIVEYFNSSGAVMMDTVQEWLEREKITMRIKHEKYLEYTYPLLSKTVQYSDTECGMWSLLYIRSRLEGKSPTWFYDSKITDDDMVNYRKFVFLNK